MKPKLNPAAAALAKPQFRQRVVRDKTKYSRKGRTDKGSALDRFWNRFVATGFPVLRPLRHSSRTV